MSLREKLNKAQADADAVRKAADLAIIDNALAKAAQGLPAAVEKVISAVQSGKKKYPDDITSTAKCKHLGIADITQADFEAMQGYRALVAACSAPENDVSLYVGVDNQTVRETETTSRCKYEALVKISISPSLPFKDHSNLVLHPSRHGQETWTKIDATATPQPAPAPAPAPSAPAEDAPKIQVMAPLKLKA